MHWLTRIGDHTAHTFTPTQAGEAHSLCGEARLHPDHIDQWRTTAPTDRYCPACSMMAAAEQAAAS